MKNLKEHRLRYTITALFVLIYLVMFYGFRNTGGGFLPTELGKVNDSTEFYSIFNNIDIYLHILFVIFFFIYIYLYLSLKSKTMFQTVVFLVCLVSLLVTLCSSILLMLQSYLPISHLFETILIVYIQILSIIFLRQKLLSLLYLVLLGIPIVHLTK